MKYEMSLCLDFHRQILHCTTDWDINQLSSAEFDVMREKSPIRIDLSMMMSDIFDIEYLYQFPKMNIWLWLREKCAGKCQFRQIAYDGRGEDDYDPSCGDFWFVRCYLDFEKASDGVLFKLKWL